jgi:hypothetical protein
MNIPRNTAMKNRSESAKAVAARYRRRVGRAEMADWKHVTHTDPSTGRTQTINIRHSRKEPANVTALPGPPPHAAPRSHP